MRINYLLYNFPLTERLLIMIDESKLIDNIVFKNNDNNNESIIFNFYTWTELIKAIIKKYTDKSEYDIDSLVYGTPLVKNALNSYMSAVVRCHETEYHWAMLLAYGERYWERGISPQEPEGYLEWDQQYRKEHNLAEESFEFSD